MSLEEQYWKHLANKICVSKDDMLPNELILIRESYILFNEKQVEIKTLEDDLKRVLIELANLKAMHDDGEYNNDEE